MTGNERLKVSATGATVLLCMVTSAALVGHSAEKKAYPLETRDWLEVDRKRFQALSTRLNGPQLTNAMPAVITFANAALYNTKNILSSEYKTVEQRNAYYNLISLVIEYDKNTPSVLRNIRFFHATTLVTLWSRIGAIDSVDNVFCANMSQETRNFLREINKRLFDANLQIINKLLFVWREPRTPRREPPSAIDAWEFDVEMVRMEQALVDKVVDEVKPSLNIRQQINSIDNCVLAHIGSIGMRGPSDQWVAESIGKPDFFNIRHRRTIGYSLITTLHGRQKDIFMNLLRTD
jgi:hypothetical protein